MARDAHHPKVLTHELAPGKLIIVSGDEIKIKDCEDAPRTGDLESFESVVALCEKLNGNAEVYVNRKQLEIVVDKANRWARVLVNFTRCDRFESLVELRQKSFTPPEAVHFLRFRLECPEQHVVDSLRRIDFHRKSDGSSVIEHGKESLGRAVEAEVQQADQVPESFFINLPIWMNPGFQFEGQVEIGIQLQPNEQRVRFIPSLDGIRLAEFNVVSQTIEALREKLGNNGDVYHGDP